MDILTLQIYIFFYFSNLKDNGHRFFEKISIDVPKLLNDPFVEGVFKFTNLNVSGLESMTLLNDLSQITVTEENAVEQTFKTCITLPITQITISSEYFVDLAYHQKIPIYGDGTLRLSIKDIEMNFCTFFNTNKGNSYGTNLKMSYHVDPIELNGFYSHPNSTNVLSNMLNIANTLLAMWNSYEPQYTTCILSPVFEYILNAAVNQADNVFNFNSTCFEGSSFNYLLTLFWYLREAFIDIITL